MRRGLQVLMAVMLATLARAQTMDPPPPASRPEEESLRKFGSREMFENMGKLLNGLEGLGPWDQHHKYFMSAVTSVYEKNGWDSESDRFSLDLIREVESKPPMAIQERFDTMVGMFSDRYMLDENQERDLRSTVMNESLQVFAKHSGRIMSYALEAIQTRASGEAFTPEQVARWAQLAEPVFNDGRERMVVAAKAFMEKLDPQQRQLVERDLEAATQRLDRVQQMGEHWARGEWSPSDWGLDNDPIQRAGEARAAQAGAAAPTGTTGATGRGAVDGKDRKSVV